MRKLFVYGVPVLGPLLGTDKVPSFEDVDKLMMALALVQGLLLSCLAGTFQSVLECSEDAEEPDEHQKVLAINFQYWSFECLCLAILFTIITYAYIVYLIDQAGGDTVEMKRMQVFWTAGGRFVMAGLVVFTVTGAVLYAWGVSRALACMYGDLHGGHWGMDGFLPGGLAMPLVACFGAMLIHVSFRKMLMEHLDDLPGGAAGELVSLTSGNFK
ncbi:unnamed protein product [Prorocentrum cordatum]|uniref:Uncharacterized protein n=1 Tax=Prorocentrum cordatum TaxID=2364126 RepID=A0ABN9QMD4_9DINO|nr:unnamed protein product [Polarella glacialis]|mmetsp:Transcript_4757/g.12553  ORF Transcript_4757/g.12553 Transcript_4757/m.12553 type:complete len:214 (+) Transcript_4757:77-718(+)